MNCDECGSKCRISYELVDEDEFHDGTERVPIYAECIRCGWSVC